MIKVIAFDYAEVVAEGPMSKWIRESLTQGDIRIEEYKKQAHKWDVGEMALDEAYKVLGKLTGNPPELVWEKFYEKSQPNWELIELIKKLKPRYKIFIFSNFIGEMLRKLLKHYKIEGLFDEIIVSSEHKMKKPDTKFFELLLKKSEVSKDEIIFTDDKINNVDASNTFGIKAFQFITAEQLIEDLKSAGVKIN